MSLKTQSYLIAFLLIKLDNYVIINMGTGRKIFRSSWIITLVGGIILGIFGITKIVEAANMYVPPMNDSGWFDASVAQTNVQTTGIVLCVIGFLFIAVTGSLILYFVARQTPEDMAKAEAKMINEEKRYRAKLQRLGVDGDTEYIRFREEYQTKPQQKFCKYCGANLNGKNECSNYEEKSND